MNQLRVLTSDWTNPNFDRRHKYGNDAVKTLPAGTKLVVRPYDFAMLWQDPATRAAVEAAYVKVNTDS